MEHLVPDGVKLWAQGDVKTVEPAALPDPLLAREKTVTDKLNSLVIDFIVGGLSQFAQHINNQQFDFFRLQKGKKDWTDKSDHCAKR